MDELSRLSDAFCNFTAAAKKVETYYEKLQERINHLTMELEKKNLELSCALHETERTKDYLKCILESIGEAIVVLDYNGNVTMINKAAEEMLGLSLKHATGKTFHSLDISLTNEDADTIVIANGKRYNVLFTVSDIFDSTSPGFVRGRVILLKDITRLKELEANHERNKRLIAMGEMAAKVVHEIRSPLCSIELYASMLKNELQGTAHTGLANGISNGIKSLNNILTNMLFFAKPQKTLLNVIDPSIVIDDSIDMLMPMIESRGIRLFKDISDNSLISGDKELLKQVFLNILLNAISVTPDGGAIMINIRKEGEFIVTDVCDEGEGIRQENIERIFDPFFSTKEKGTGLGLTIASKIMQAHEGIIKVKSKWGEGSCFQLYFPIESKHKYTNKIGKELFFYETNPCC